MQRHFLHHLWSIHLPEWIPRTHPSVTNHDSSLNVIQLLDGRGSMHDAHGIFWSVLHRSDCSICLTLAAKCEESNTSRVTITEPNGIYLFLRVIFILMEEWCSYFSFLSFEWWSSAWKNKLSFYFGFPPFTKCVNFHLTTCWFSH